MNHLETHICTCLQCKIGSTESNPTGKGKETVFRLLNTDNKKVDKYIVDDCLLKAHPTEEKCDYLFRIVNDKIIFLVECKGSDILKAVRQIESSMRILSNSLEQNRIKGRIISTKVHSPDIRSRYYSALREKLKGDLIVKNYKLEDKI